MQCVGPFVLFVAEYLAQHAEAPADACQRAAADGPFTHLGIIQSFWHPRLAFEIALKAIETVPRSPSFYNIPTVVSPW